MPLYQVPRGTQDILPQEQGLWRYVENAAISLCHLYGYERIDTPTFEETALFVRGVGEGTDIVDKEMYSFLDKGGTSLTLRPEGTAPVCRAYLEHGLHNRPQPVKLFYWAPVFRYDRPQKGRYREHHQFGFEAIGDADPALDAEVVEMAWRFYQSLGLPGLSLLINSIGCLACRPGYIESLRRYFEPHRAALCPDCRKRLERNTLRLLDCKQPPCQALAAAAPRSADHLCRECKAHFDALKLYLIVTGLPFEANHRLVRGLDYYTRTVFEIQPSGGGAQSTIGGGGRYDGLIEELGGPPTPGVGFATGIERIILNLKEQKVSPPNEEAPLIYVAYSGSEAKETALATASRLRAAGFAIRLSFGERSLKAQLKQANASGVRYAIIIGEAEAQSGEVTLRDMRSSSQRSVPADELIWVLKAASS